MKTLATLAIGKVYEENFNRYCLANWQAYAQKCGYDLKVFTKPLDSSSRAKERSPAWQKCLVFEELSSYSQVIWVDSDILINARSAPPITEFVSVDRIGAVDAYSWPSPEAYRTRLQRLYDQWRAEGINYIDNLTPQQFHTNFGLPGDVNRVVQTGVIVASPAQHAQIFRQVYDNYEDKGGLEWTYEMRPLSYELVKSGMVTWLDARFNYIWSETKAFDYPFLATQNGRRMRFVERVLRKLGLIEIESPAEAHKRLLSQCVTTAYQNAWFLHFAGGMADMPYVDRGVM